jgi:hypothetical protein
VLHQVKNMNDKKKKHFFLMVSIPFALSYWFFDSAVHYFGYGEFEFEIIPSDFNEMWMRSIIFIMLVVFGIFADHHANKLVRKDIEKHEVYIATLRASHHILNNFLNKMTLFREEAEISEDFDKDILKLYDQVIDDAAAQLRNLENIKELDTDNIEKSYKPK